MHRNLIKIWYNENKINDTEIIQIVLLSRQYFDDSFSVKKKCQLPSNNSTHIFINCMHKLATYILMELLLKLIIEVREVYDYYKTKELEQWF